MDVIGLDGVPASDRYSAGVAMGNYDPGGAPIFFTQSMIQYIILWTFFLLFIMSVKKTLLCSIGRTDSHVCLEIVIQINN